MSDTSHLRKQLEDNPYQLTEKTALLVIADALYYIGDSLALIGMAQQGTDEPPDEPSQYIDGTPIEK